MKNIKNTIAAMSLMAVMGLGATAANAGIMVSDRSVTPAQTVCSTEGIMSQLEGIIIVGLASSREGIMMSDRLGIMMSDRSTPCVQGNTVEGQNDDGIIIVG